MFSSMFWFLIKTQLVFKNELFLNEYRHFAYDYFNKAKHSSKTALCLIHKLNINSIDTLALS